MLTETCERLWEVDAFRGGSLSTRDADSFARHREGCDACRQRLVDDDELSALGRALPPPKVDAFHERRLRQAIMRRAARGEETSGSPRSPFAPIVGVIVVAALSVLAMLVFRSRAPHLDAVPGSAVARPFGATIEAGPGAIWTARTEAATERVTLRDGILTLQVRHRELGERFIVDLPDGEIEVRGTRFMVEVVGDVTRSVRVFEGLVALRRRGAGEVLIATGENWLRIDAKIEVAPTVAKNAVTTAEAPRRRLSPRKARVLPSAPKAAIADTSNYEAAVELFAAQDYEEAARALHAYALVHADRPEAEDAEFLEASALAHAGRFDAAAVVAERFLDRYPHSLHAADAATLAVRAARDRDDCVRARVLALRWIHDPASRDFILGSCVDP